jgi:hypothetical protein
MSSAARLPVFYCSLWGDVAGVSPAEGGAPQPCAARGGGADLQSKSDPPG